MKKILFYSLLLFLICGCNLQVNDEKISKEEAIQYIDRIAFSDNYNKRSFVSENICPTCEEKMSCDYYSYISSRNYGDFSGASRKPSIKVEICYNCQNFLILTECQSRTAQQSRPKGFHKDRNGDWIKELYRGHIHNY